MNIVSIVSGGLDSVTLSYSLRAQYPEANLSLISFNYGQRHSKELDYAKKAAEVLNASWHLVDLSSIQGVLSGSALTDDIEVPDGHYAEETMKITVVPNRNAIMISVAAGLLVSQGGGLLATAVHAGDHFIYPDCRPEFIEALARATQLGSEGIANIDLVAPFSNLTKAEIVSIGEPVGVQWDQTWSCYKGGENHCGVCGTCTERREAFEIAKVKDPTKYNSLERHW